MKKNFNLYSKYYDLLYENKDYVSETNFINSCIKNHMPDTKTILEFGSGTGKHGLLLQKYGYNIFGLDSSEAMIEKAKKQGYNCKVADISNFNLDSKFDCILALFHVISYLNSNEKLINTFKNANNHLNKNGIFIFDVWYSPSVFTQKVEKRLKTVSNEDIVVNRFAEPKWNYQENVIDVNYKILVKEIKTKLCEEINEKHSMRHFTIPEINLLAELTGFKVEKTMEFLTGKEPSVDTWGVNFILRKKK